jgi:SnoaL-like polyketide cyclase/SnoaL-like domain
MKLAPAFHTSAAMHGFHAEFKNLDDYIRVITDRIWEGRQVEAIREYYSDPCGVITPTGASTDVQAVIDGTQATLSQFPDRRLLAEDVIEAGDAQAGFLSSHRIISTMTHLGDGNFGKATGKKIHVRTVADCVCKDNRIVHEWLVRDQAAIAVAIGKTPQTLAREWLAKRTTPLLPLPLPAAPVWWRNPISDEPVAKSYADRVGHMLTGADFDEALYDEAACSLGPVNSTHYGRAEIKNFYADYAAAVGAATFDIDSLAFMPASSSAGRPPRVALRWRLKGLHVGQGKFGVSQSKPLDILGINHAEFVKVNGQWQVHREWVLIDEVAVWMQVLDGTVSKA